MPMGICLDTKNAWSKGQAFFCLYISILNTGIRKWKSVGWQMTRIAVACYNFSPKAKSPASPMPGTI